MCWQGINYHWPFLVCSSSLYGADFIYSFRMGHIYEKAQIIKNRGTLLHTTVCSLTYDVFYVWSVPTYQSYYH